ncbi:MAG TPA: hypothetical protein VL424_21665, partial [Pararobbsia sp.]|nr:hypothetical protein [Pararobbsia sp.]
IATRRATARASSASTHSATHVAAPASKGAARTSASSSSPASGKRRRLNGRLDGPHGLVPPLAPVSPRPVWLLPEPQKLATRQGLPYYRSTMQIVSGPECIEAGWWDGQGATRDYFIVSGDDVTLYWVYRERTVSGERDAPAWYLHGVFG